MGTACVAIAADSPLCPRALGFSGDNARGGSRALASAPAPVTLLLIGGRVAGPVPFVVPDGCAAVWTPLGKSEGASKSSLPSACLRDFSCLFWTDRKWDRSSDHLISSRFSLDRVAEITEVLQNTTLSRQYKRMIGRDLRLRGYVQEASGVHSVETISKGYEGRALW